MTTTTTIDFNPLGPVRIDFEDVFATAGIGAHRLAIRLKHSAAWLAQPAQGAAPAASPALLTGTVEIESGGVRWFAGFEPKVLVLRSYPVSDDLLVSTTDEQVIALERARGDGGFWLVVTFQLVLLEPPGAVYPIRDDQVRMPVSATRWQELLDQLGSEVGIVIRVPSALIGGTPTPGANAGTEAGQSRLAGRLRQARQQVRDHQWEEAVSTCRKALEGIPVLAGSMPSAASLKSVDAQHRTADQRWAAIYHDACSLASAAHHDDDVTADFTWSRADSEAVLAVTAALLNHYLASP